MEVGLEFDGQGEDGGAPGWCQPMDTGVIWAQMGVLVGLFSTEKAERNRFLDFRACINEASIYC